MSNDVPSRVKGGAPVDSHDDDQDEGEFDGNRSDSAGNEKDEAIAPRPQQSRQPESYTLNVKMSETLYKRLLQVARDEGVSADDFACELLSEGIVLRAWEIVEKKSAMRGSNAGNQPQGNQQRHGHKGGGHSGGGGGGGGPRRGGGGGGSGGGGGGGPRRGGYANTMNLLEDKAAFLEYVRNQERRQR